MATSDEPLPDSGHGTSSSHSDRNGCSDDRESATDGSDSKAGNRPVRTDEPVSDFDATGSTGPAGTTGPADTAEPAGSSTPAAWMRPYDADLTGTPSGSEAPETDGDRPGTSQETSDDRPYTLLNPPEQWQHSGPDWHRVEKVPSAGTPSAAPPAGNRHFGFLVRCHLLVFVSSICVMVLELTASRLIARHVGSSLYTWTSVIGVILAGISLGNLAGGWLAERFRKTRILSWLFAAASGTCLSVLWLDRLTGQQSRPEGTDWPTWVFLVVAQMFFLPAFALGTIPPVVTSLALRRSRRMSLTVGSIYAWGAAGSIAGTFLTGFWLIDQFGTRMIIGGTAGILALLGILVASGQRVFRTALVTGWIPFVLATTTIAAATSSSMGHLAERAALLFGTRDTALQNLAAWYHSGTEPQLDRDTRNTLKIRQDLDSLVAVDRAAMDEFRRWCRSGNRHHMSHQVRRTVEALIAATDADPQTVRRWRLRGERLGLTLNQLGRLLSLRVDRPGEYHDESSYSSISITTRYSDEFQTPLRQLQLDKLVHSYFDPAVPTRLCYRYERIYAEVTDRVTRHWNPASTADVAPFRGRDELAARLPEWAQFDSAANTLTVSGTLTSTRRRELIALAPPGNYWLAIEKLAARTRAEDWSGFSSVELDALPDGADTDVFLKARLTFEPASGTLSTTHRLSSRDVDRLCSAGSARRFAAWRTAVNTLSQQTPRLDAFFIGGGGFVFPRWVEHQFSSHSRIDVAELDPAVKRAVQREMGLPPDGQTRIRTLIGDARNIVDDLLRTRQRHATGNRPVVQYDCVYGDAFHDFSVPWHLTTREFALRIRSLLKPERGVYLVNVIDFWPRTVWPAPASRTDRPGLTRGIPAALAAGFKAESGEEGPARWHPGPGTLSAFETRRQADGTWHFAVRGVMPDTLREELSRLAGTGGSPEFLSVLDDLDRRSRQQRGGRFLSSCTITLADVFPHVYVFSTGRDVPPEGRATFVLIASLQPLPLENLADQGTYWKTDPFASIETRPDGSKQLTGQMESLLATARGLILTDDFAPVDNLLQPVFERQND